MFGKAFKFKYTSGKWGISPGWLVRIPTGTGAISLVPVALRTGTKALPRGRGQTLVGVGPLVPVRVTNRD
jgi:hypothetical protein